MAGSLSKKDKAKLNTLSKPEWEKRGMQLADVVSAGFAPQAREHSGETRA